MKLEQNLRDRYERKKPTQGQKPWDYWNWCFTPERPGFNYGPREILIIETNLGCFSSSLWRDDYPSTRGFRDQLEVIGYWHGVKQPPRRALHPKATPFQ